MAHIKVQRRSMRPEEFIGIRYAFLKKHLYRYSEAVSPVYIREARLIDEGAYEYYDEAPRPIEQGELCYTPDGSAFFYAEIPRFSWKEGLCLWFQTSSEVIVKINGRYAGAFDPNRSEIDLRPFADEQALSVEMLGYNRSKPDDDRNPEVRARRGCRQKFGGLFLKQKDETVQSLCYDLELFTDIIGSESFPEDYRSFLIREIGAALNEIDLEDFRTEDALRAAERIETNVYRSGVYRGSGRVALISHSHLDIAYYWRRCHTLQKNLRTVLAQLRLMDRYPEFRYAHSQAYTYETLEKEAPEVFEELRGRIAEGRFEPVGAMYVEPDCNIPNAESLIRQCLYGQTYYKDRFGFYVENCWLPDVFGNSWILPQILRKSGVKYFVSNKMSTWNDTNRFPHNHFIWRGIDGTEVYACVPPTHFITWNAPSQIAENWDAFQDKDTDTETLSMFGYGDGGSGATEEMLELMRRMERLSVMPRIRHVTAKQFLEENFRDDVPLAVWDGELYLEMHRGTFTTKGWLKRKNRELEQLFRAAELVSALRMLEGKPYPARELRALYKEFLVNQFHDILPGSHIAPVFQDAVRDLTRIGERLRELMGAPEGALFNPLNDERDGVEFIPCEDGGEERAGVRGEFRRVSFGPLSYGKALPARGNADWFTLTQNGVETPFYRVRFEADGSFSSLFDLTLGREWCGGPMNRLMLYDDRPGVYDAWDILPDHADRPCPLSVVQSAAFAKADDESLCFTAKLAAKNSAIVIKIRFFRSDRAIETEYYVDWHESHKLLKVLFTPAVLTREVLCDTSAGFIRRPLTKNTTWEQARFECCCHKWFDLSETDAGFAVINDGKYGIGIPEKGVSLSLLRATERPDPGSDLGEHRFCYRMVPHAGNAAEAGIERLARVYNAPLIRADVPDRGKRFACFAPLYLQAVKLSEDGSRVIFRLCETDGRRGTLRLPCEFRTTDLLERETGKTASAPFTPFEILTLALELSEYRRIFG